MQKSQSIKLSRSELPTCWPSHLHGGMEIQEKERTGMKAFTHTEDILDLNSNSVEKFYDFNVDTTT